MLLCMAFAGIGLYVLYLTVAAARSGVGLIRASSHKCGLMLGLLSKNKHAVDIL
jgi:hypothetical protein